MSFNFLPLCPSLISIAFLDTTFLSSCWVLDVGRSCCCFHSQDRSMNPGAFSNSGPLSWAMYLMRKGRTGSGLFGNSTSSSIFCCHQTGLLCRRTVTSLPISPCTIPELLGVMTHLNCGNSQLFKPTLILALFHDISRIQFHKRVIV